MCIKLKDSQTDRQTDRQTLESEEYKTLGNLLQHHRQSKALGMRM